MTPSILIIAAKWWALSARLAADFVRHDCRVSVLCPVGHPLRHVRGLDRIERYTGIRSLACLSRAIRSVRPDIIIPCDDGVVAQLHALHALEPSLRTLIEFSLGSPASFPIVRSRRQLLAAAMQLDIAVPETRRVTSAEDVTAWCRETRDVCVLKRDGESGGNGVRVCQSLVDVLAGWKELHAPQRLATALKRLTIDRDPLALWLSRHCRQPDITIQRFVQGRPANTMVACLDGEVLSEASVVVLSADGPTGAATVIRRVQEPRMAQAARLLARRFNLSGFFGLDFMIEARTDVPYLIEMNPRSTQLGHLEFLDQGSLAGALSARLRGKAAPAAEKPILLETVALFPQALRTLPNGSRRLQGAYLDMPVDQPALLAELKRDPWPQRRWAARLYHKARPMERISSVEYEFVAAPRSAPQSSPVLVGAAREAASSR